MKKFLAFSIFASSLLYGSAFAGDIVSPLKGNPESWYDVTHSTVAVSSQTVSSDSLVNAASTTYRCVYIYNLSPSVTVYYTLSTSTQNVTVIGWPIFPWRTVTGAAPLPEKIEYNGQINYRAAPGAVGSVDIIKKTIRK